jgi:hypothetical protein
MVQKLSYEKRLEIATRIYEALRSFYQDRIVVLNDASALRRALRLGRADRDIQSRREKE